MAEELQLRFKEEPTSIKVGDTLKYTTEDGGYFINQNGFRLDTLPEGTLIRTKSFGMSFSGVAMPASEGKILHKDGKTYFEGKIFSAFNVLRFWNNDELEIISLPQ